MSNPNPFPFLRSFVFGGTVPNALDPCYFAINSLVGDDPVGLNLAQFIGVTFTPIEYIYPINATLVLGVSKNAYFDINDWEAFLFHFFKHRRLIENIGGKYKWTISLNSSAALTAFQKFFTCNVDGRNFNVIEFPLVTNQTDNAKNLFNTQFEIILPYEAALAFGAVQPNETINFDVTCEYIPN